jgi:dTDP-4-amino-4,6-dideoxygalactose transaminase
MSQRVTLDDLAIFGARPLFDEPLHVGRPNLGDRRRLLERIDEIAERRWLTNDGPCVRDFERRVADLVEVEHCVAVSSATVGLQLAARSLGLAGEVIVPSFTFVATAHALAWSGLTPVFCDIDRWTHTVDTQALDALVTPRTGGVVAVHLWGRPCDVEALTEFAERHGLPLLFDASHALGCSHRGRPIGGFGDAEVFSFHATKVVNAAEGGAITTNDGDLADRLRLMRNYSFVDYDSVIDVGTNAKMSELSAAMGLTSLESLDEFVAVNRRNYACYAAELSGVSGISLLAYDDNERNNYHYVVLEIAADAKLSRDDLIAALHAENVLARRYFYPGCHRLEAYAGASARPGALLSATDHVAAHVIVLPTGTAIEEADVAGICGIVRIAAANATDLRRRIAGATVPV